MTSEKDDYFVIVDWNQINKILKKYPRDFKSRVKRNITLLSKNPEKGTKLDNTKNASLYKKRFGEFEIYYTVENVAVVVLDVLYVGTIRFYSAEQRVKSGRSTGKSSVKQDSIISKHKKVFRKKYG